MLKKQFEARAQNLASEVMTQKEVAEVKKANTQLKKDLADKFVPFSLLPSYYVALFLLFHVRFNRSKKVELLEAKNAKLQEDIAALRAKQKTDSKEKKAAGVYSSLSLSLSLSLSFR